MRIGSGTKTFVAERRVDLDASVDTCRPGLVRGEGIDGRRVTVRQLLRPTSGLPNDSDHLGDDVQ
ncbi:hypothetical protein ACWDRR_01670 [Kitasatospora sp. NPDC003701]